MDTNRHNLVSVARVASDYRVHVHGSSMSPNGPSHLLFLPYHKIMFVLVIIGIYCRMLKMKLLSVEIYHISIMLIY